MIADRCETWQILWMPLRIICDDPSLQSLREAERTEDAARELGQWCDRVISDPGACRQDIAELAVAAQFTELLARKVSLAHQVKAGVTEAFGMRESQRALADQLPAAADAYSDCWRARNKISGLNDILHALSSLREELLHCQT